MATTKSRPTRQAGFPDPATPGATRLDPGRTHGGDADLGAEYLDALNADESTVLEPPVDDPAGGLRRFAAWLVVAGVLGSAAAFTLTVDKIKLIQDPSFSPSCNVNPIVNCGNVMKTGQAQAFGFPNSLIGVAAFAVLTAVGLTLLAGARFRPWFWAGMEAGAAFGAVFVHWLAFQSMFRIGSLCPWCMVVWAVVLPTFVAVTSYATRTGQFGTGLVPFGRWLHRHTAEILIVWFLVFVVTAGVRFWNFWQTFV